MDVGKAERVEKLEGVVGCRSRSDKVARVEPTLILYALLLLYSLMDAAVTSSTGSGTHQIFVKNLTGRTITIDVSRYHTNRAVLDLVEQKTGEEAARGVWKGKQLDPDALCTMAKEDTLHVLPRMRGGVESQTTMQTNDGVINFFDAAGKNVRRKYAEGHAQHGVISFLDAAGKAVRLEYAEGHAQHGVINFFDAAGKNVRRKYAEGHAQHGVISFFDAAGKAVRLEYAEGHAQHGVINFFAAGKAVRREYAEGHAQHGKIMYFDGEATEEVTPPPTRSKKRKSEGKARKPKKAIKATSRKARGGSGAMEGEQELDYAEVLRQCLPPAASLCPPDAQLDAHKKALTVATPPDRIHYTDEASCALDSYNMGANPPEPITRAELEGDTGGSSASAAPALPLGVCGEAPSSIPPSPPEGASVGGDADEPKAVNLGHARMVAAMKKRDHVLEPIGGKGIAPKLQRVLKQRRGVYLVEFHWINKAGERDYHVIAVNCDLRLVFCNTLGALPFSLAGAVGKWLQRESDETHDNIAERFHVSMVTRVWRVLRR